MTPVKIQCACGQKYSFEVEPMDGRVPAPVACPVCGRDGTAEANEALRWLVPPASPARVDETPLEPAPDPAPPPPPSRVRRGGLPRWLAPAAGVLVVVGVGLAAWQFLASRGGGGGEEAPVPSLTQLVGPGVPKTLADLAGFYAEPAPGQNAADDYTKGFEAIQITRQQRQSPNLPWIGKGKLPAPGTRFPQAAAREMAGVTRSAKEAFELFEPGHAKEGSRYPMNFNLGMDMPLPHLAKLKSSIQILAMSAILEAEAGNASNAARRVAGLLKVAASLENEPLMISQLVRRSGFAIAKQALERAMSATPFAAADLDTLAALLAAMDQRESAGEHWTRVMLGERVQFVAICESEAVFNRFKESQNQNLDALGKSFADFKKLFAPDKRHMEEMYFEILSTRKEPLPGRLRADEAAKRFIDEAKERRLTLFMMLVPALGGATKEEARLVSNLRLMRAGVALERHRLGRANAYPETLAGLVPEYLPEIPQDPFTGQPYQYSLAGFRVELSGTGAKEGEELDFVLERR